MQQLTEAVNQFARTQLSTTNNPQQLYDQLLKAVEQPYIQAMLKEFHGNQSQCAIALGLNRATLRTKMRRYDLL